MLGNLIRAISRTLVLNSNSVDTLKCGNRLFTYSKCFTNLSCLNKFYTESGSKENPFDSDEYIIPYKTESETKESSISSRQDLNEALRAKFRMKQSQLKDIFAADLKFKRNQIKDLDKVLDILLENTIHRDSIVDNPWLLTMTPRLLHNKFNVLNELKVGNINDFVPFLRLSLPCLMKIIQSMKRESSQVPGGNRLYFISDRLGLDTKVVAKYLARRLFMIEMSFETLHENLHNMMDFRVPPISILRDLWAFRYTPKSVKCRLERAKNAKKNKIMPWMVRCPETIFSKSLKRSLDEKKLLGENSTVVEYVSKRLGYDPDTMSAIMAKHPATLKVGVIKIKEILDYLLDVEDYQPHEIAQTIRILCHGLETTKNRLAELKSYGCRPSSLIIVCRSRKEYEKFVRQWLSMQNKMKTPGT